VYDGTTSQNISCADYVVSSYIPTLTTLLRIQKTSSVLARSNVSLCLIAERRAQDPSLPEISGVLQEIADITAVAESRHIMNIYQTSSSTTVSAVSAAMEEANIVHLACHGIQDSSQATQSGFCLGDGRLTITKLMELRVSKAFLAFLGACDTAKGDKEQPDQAMHLAAAMLFSGFKSIIATMWYVFHTMFTYI
jgi:CHAT domain-containing protein